MSPSTPPGQIRTHQFICAEWPASISFRSAPSKLVGLALKPRFYLVTSAASDQVSGDGMYGVHKALSRGPHMGKAVRTEITRDSLVDQPGVGNAAAPGGFPHRWRWASQALSPLVLTGSGVSQIPATLLRWNARHHDPAPPCSSATGIFCTSQTASSASDACRPSCRSACSIASSMLTVLRTSSNCSRISGA